MSNIDSKPTSPKGNGGQTYVAHHKITILGRPTERMLDGCYKHPTCDNCPEDIKNCTGSYKKGK